jgi:membrane protease YdiL (CAAX protease family)
MERWGRALGIVAAAAVYAAAHWAAFNPLLALAAFGCGLYWGWLYAATGDLSAPIVSHLLWDTLLLSFPLVRSVS